LHTFIFIIGEHESRDVVTTVPLTAIPTAQQAIQHIPYPQQATMVQIPPRRNNDPANGSNAVRVSQEQHALNHQTSNPVVNTAINNPITSTASFKSLQQPQNRYITTSRSQQTPATNAIPIVQTSPNNAAISTYGHRDSTMTYTQFYTFVNHIVQHKEEYCQAYKQTFVVGPIHQIGTKLYFNIEKVSRRSKENDQSTSSGMTFDKKVQRRTLFLGL
jgi:hypothetical protein